MLRDPFYRQIVDRLQGQLEPELFEQCAADILRAIYPTLVPIRGGSDSGMDGAIADTDGEPFPLVTTTSPKVIDNLTRNLTTYIHDGGRRRKVVLATSQDLTPKRKNNLFQRAADLGFTLIQIHDQPAIANLLYRDPRWCRELLGLTGDPPALSAVPRSDRPLLSEVLVGRVDDLAWLNARSGDRLLVGQPGSGKTALMNTMVHKRGALFVVSQDRGQIATDVRSAQPAVLLVDDAHLHLNLLRDLRHLRSEIHAEFAILASCWPGERDLVTSVLDIPSDSVRELQPLTRDEIVEVIKATGVMGSNDLIRELVDQADGRPGLAVTLTHLCLRGDVREVVSGNILTHSLLSLFVSRYGRKTSAILAAFALGGASGMPTKVVANAVGLSPLDLWDFVSNIAAGGTLSDEGDGALSVHPEPLRYALVRETFFTSTSPFPVEGLLGGVPHLPDTVFTLIGARTRGAPIPLTLLVALLEQARSIRCWNAFASSGKEEATLVLERYPALATAIAQPALNWVPERVLPLLLKASVGDDRALHSTPDHPLRVIADWINRSDPRSYESIRRREVLLRSVEQWHAGGGDSTTELRAVPKIMLPTFEAGSLDPGAGMTYTIRYGYLLPDLITALQALWPRVHRLIVDMQPSDWLPIREMVEHWAYPSHRGVEIAAELAQELKGFAGQMMRDLLPQLRVHPGLARWATQIAYEVGIILEVERTPSFDLLYPEDRYDIDIYRHQAEDVRRLAAQWREKPPEEVITNIVEIEQAARAAQMHWPRLTPLLCAEIASTAQSPATWCAAAIDAELSSDLVEPFLRAAALSEEPAWQALVRRCLEHHYLKSSAIWVLLTLPMPPKILLEDAFRQAPDFVQMVKTLCIREQIPEPTLKSLLQHGNSDVAGAAAWGEWFAEPRGSVRPGLLVEWRRAIITADAEDHGLAQIFAQDADLAIEWLNHRLTLTDFPFYRFKQALGVVGEVLTTEQRRVLLERIPAQFSAHDTVPILVGNDPTLFRMLLDMDHLRDYHLTPLTGDPDEHWIEMAKLALDAGYSYEEVAAAVHNTLRGSRKGPESAMWSERAQIFESLCIHDDAQMRAIGKIGHSDAIKRRDQALAQERQEAIRGLRK